MSFQFRGFTTDLRLSISTALRDIIIYKQITRGNYQLGVHTISYFNTCMAIMVVWCFLGTGHYELAWERVIFEEGLIIFFSSDLYLSVPFFT